MRGCSRGDCGAVGRNAVGVSVVLLGGMQSGCLWCCWEECSRGECCRGGSGMRGCCRGGCGVARIL